MKILAVDDDTLMLEMIRSYLMRAGYSDVTTCCSSRQAMNRVADSEDLFDCFLLDIDMPVLDGIWLCEKIRQKRSYITTPIIMLTAKLDVSFVQRSYDAGATDYIHKPFVVEDLIVRLNHARAVKNAQLRANSKVSAAWINRKSGGDHHNIMKSLHRQLSSSE